MITQMDFWLLTGRTVLFTVSGLRLAGIQAVICG